MCRTSLDQTSSLFTFFPFSLSHLVSLQVSLMLSYFAQPLTFWLDLGIALITLFICQCRRYTCNGSFLFLFCCSQTGSKNGQDHFWLINPKIDFFDLGLGDTFLSDKFTLLRQLMMLFLGRLINRLFSFQSDSKKDSNLSRKRWICYQKLNPEHVLSQTKSWNLIIIDLLVSG